jgi:hypothetical protein
MPGKRATARSQPEIEQRLSKADACQLLQVAPSADEELITQAYWHQARKVQAFAKTDPKARKRLDELNRAYRVLNPSGGDPPLERELGPYKDERPITEHLGAALNNIVEETAKRWPGRAMEVAVLSATTGILTFLALGAGADIAFTIIAAAAAAITIWAPWRREGTRK